MLTQRNSRKGQKHELSQQEGSIEEKL